MKVRLWGMMTVLAGLVIMMPLTAHAGRGDSMGMNVRTEAGGRTGGPMGPSNLVGPNDSAGLPSRNGSVDWACPRDCADYTMTCRRTAQEGERLCAQTTCAEEAQAVHDACSAAPRSVDCWKARIALRQCNLPCLQDSAAELLACRNQEITCLRSCPASAGLAHKDPLCVDTCGESFAECLTAADDTAANCRAECEEKVSAAQAACEQDPTSSDCEQSRRQAYACLAPCGDTLQADRRACIRGAQDCVAECPEVTPASTTGQ